ncbi:MAG: T9SS type A sorting domain-containing protein [Bacteroidota bacterium]
MKKSLLFCAFFVFSLLSNILHAQNWHYYNPTSWFDVNSVEIPRLGVIAVGGGWETQDSVQIMFQTEDFGLSWYENSHDGPAPWNKSIAFSDSINGFGVGYDGRIIKSNDAGRNWGYPTVPIERDLNKIVYVDAGTYFVAGGTKSSDSMQTILKTTDNGNTWIVKRDTYGSWLNSISFIDTLKGFAVGDNGVIISTINGGNTWQSLVAPLQRDYTGIKFINSNVGYIVGGIATGLSRKTILRTINGGVNWSTLLDTTGGILNDISFADSLVGYSVGDSATVLKTINGGLSWQPILIDVNLVGNETFNAVKFLDKNFGAIGGKNGVLYVFHNPLPRVYSLPASDVTINSAKLKGIVNTGGLSASITFEYGTTTAYGTEVSAVPNSFSDTLDHSVSYLLSGLGSSTIYHFRVKATNQYGVSYGSDMTFVAGGPTVFTLNASNISTDSAQLNASVNANNFASTVIFEYGTSINYGSQIVAIPNIVSGNTPTNVYAFLPNLVSSTVYHFRVKATNANGTVYGNDNIFETNTPISARTLPATEILLNGARLNGIIFADGMSTDIKFEYGNTTAYGNEISATPNSSSDTISVNASAIISGLTAQTMYHYRIKGINNQTTNYGNDLQFFTGYPEIPNFDFEMWDTIANNLPNNYNQTIGNITKYSPGCNGNFAVKIQNTSDGGLGAIAIGNIGDGVFLGGVPFNARPDSMVACFNYNIDISDTAWIALLFKKNGVLFPKKILKIVGSSGGNFIDLKFPITYESTDIPDSLIMVIASSNFNQNFHIPSNWLIIDDIRFTGTTVNIPNHDFELWQDNFVVNLTDWNYDRKGVIPVDTTTSTLYLTSDAQYNNFGVKLKTVYRPDGRSLVKLFTGNNNTNKIPVTSIHNSLTGYYKFFPENNDTMSVSILMFKNGIQVGRGDFSQNQTTSNYAPFVINIDYYSSSEIPDSTSINIQAFNSGGRPRGNSVLYVDNLNFDGFLSGVKETPLMVTPNDFNFNICPNPFSDNATVSFTLNNDEHVILRLFDLSGKQISLLANRKYSSGNHTLNFSSEGLKKGFYICVITSKNNNYSKKIVIQ